eukprot:CAMPEP_0206323000 /NCGR_PEP_ID=MMETSP0106_2-20121207/19736_1 /ASSEMBLY_ACC=CAM_ASM_000206 /TAXON_ID=81532 /ORGANISM="Acanthoeca-like sp., Strain 10tr" /LENGTH=77 /DNA_ID=CAMNT_0053755231 /DNA_START=292 /DNA_END=522 /DNA_ORIENTATION=+
MGHMCWRVCRGLTGGTPSLLGRVASSHERGNKVVEGVGVRAPGVLRALERVQDQPGGPAPQEPPRPLCREHKVVVTH